VYSTLLVLAGYLAAELLLGGTAAALAILALCTGEFLFLLIFRRDRRPSVLIEGGVLAAVSLAGTLLADIGYSGAEYILLESVLGLALLISAAAGKPWLASQMKRFAGLRPSSDRVREMSILMGLLFLAHSMILGIQLAVTGGIPLLPALGSFAVLYIAVFTILRRRARRRFRADAPGLVPLQDGGWELRRAGDLLAVMQLEPGQIAVADCVELKGIDAAVFLDTMEDCLRSRGSRVLRFRSWTGDTIPLEMSGYRHSQAGWNKVLS